MNAIIRRMKPFGSFLLGFLLLGLLVSAGCTSDATVSQPAAGGARGVPVVVASATQKSVPVEVRAIGNVEAYSTVSVKAQVEGTIEKAYFTEGQEVKKGDLLFTIDARPFQATLQQLQANLARDQANLENAIAQSGRSAKLFEAGIVSQDQYDTFRTSADALRAAVQADKAGIEKAKIDLDYCTIRSPMDGRTGSLLVNPGNVTKSNDTVLVIINQISPIYVSFSVPEQSLAEIRRRMSLGGLPVLATIPQDDRPAAEGSLSFVDNMVDKNTGTIRLKATFSNPDHRLWPGQFVNTSLRLSTQANAVVVPSQAVQTGQSGFFAYVVKSDLSVELRPIVPGNQVSGETVIEKGLQAGETVVTDGQLLLFPGAKVEVKKQ
ncbi:MAG: efflux RND transporter periplasmic adaptor subunit [Terriglobia bacterium]